MNNFDDMKLAVEALSGGKNTLSAHTSISTFSSLSRFLRFTERSSSPKIMLLAVVSYSTCLPGGNDSGATLPLDDSNPRNNKDYTITVEAEAADGFVGDIVISDKMLNGFKIAYTGSASSVKVKCYVQGGK